MPVSSPRWLRGWCGMCPSVPPQPASAMAGVVRDRHRVGDPYRCWLYRDDPRVWPPHPLCACSPTIGLQPPRMFSLYALDVRRLCGPARTLCTESALNRLAPHGVGLYDVGWQPHPARASALRCGLSLPLCRWRSNRRGGYLDASYKVDHPPSCRGSIDLPHTGRLDRPRQGLGYSVSRWSRRQRGRYGSVEAQHLASNYVEHSELAAVFTTYVARLNTTFSLPTPKASARC